MERLDLRLVEYFLAVAEELHFGRAAERLHIAQPSLSQQIRRLEGQLGVTLLDRNSRTVRLTDAGETLLRGAREVLSHARYAIHTTRAASAGCLVVGFYGSAGSRLLPRLLAVASVHPLAARDSVQFADLADESFITNPAVQDHGARPPRWLAEQHRHGLPGRVIAQSTGVLELLTLVAAQRGISLVPATVVRDYPRREIAYVPVNDAEPAVVSLARRPGVPIPAVTAFIETVQTLPRGSPYAGGDTPEP